VRNIEIPAPWYRPGLAGSKRSLPITLQSDRTHPNIYPTVTARYAIAQQDAKNAAAAMAEVQEKADGLESENRRLVEQVSQ